MKILIIGENRYEIYEQAFCKAFIELGHECKIFGWNTYTSKGSLFNKIENKFLLGPSIQKINSDLISYVKNFEPDLIFMYRPVMIFPKTIEQIKELVEVKIFTYHNDDPFNKNIPRYMNRYFLKSLLYCDWIFSYRAKNINDYHRLGYKNVSLLRSYYLKEKNFYIPDIKKIYDVLFVGHFENDGRDEYIVHLLKNNIDVKIFGTNWEKSKYHDEIVEKAGEIQTVYGSEYNIVINQAKIALVFLSKLNNDTYTRRCFEIPATKTAMFSVYSEDMVNNLYEERQEVEYFKDKNELLIKIKEYLEAEDKYIDLGEAAYRRLMVDGHEVINRSNIIIDKYKELNNE